MQLEGRLQALPFYHPRHLKGWPHADGCVLTPFFMHACACACFGAWVGSRVEDSYGARARHAHAHAHVTCACACACACVCMCMRMFMYVCCAGGAATTGGAAAAGAWKAQVTDIYFVVG